MQNSNYDFAIAAFTQLDKKQREYKLVYSSHPLFPEQKFREEFERIKDSWANRKAIHPGNSLAGDLETISIDYDRIKFQNLKDCAFINQLFSEVLGYYNSICWDFEKNHLPKERFIDYLKWYKKVLTENKDIGLANWNVPQAQQINLKIAEIIPNK